MSQAKRRGMKDAARGKINRSLARQKYRARREGKSYAAQVECVKTIKEVKRINSDREESEKQMNMKEREREEEESDEESSAGDKKRETREGVRRGQ